jgi:hypothetical protein
MNEYLLSILGRDVTYLVYQSLHSLAQGEVNLQIKGRSRRKSLEWIIFKKYLKFKAKI